eukprot:Nitzschia sp. Nitz4//scaffold29_size155292//123288//124700//NITZ4_002683-RA/size155292-processed-gene-0.56-mRNA-1//-1//CDS//3329546523//1556//frame0
MPFGEASSNSYGTHRSSASHGESSSLHSPQDAVRNRINRQGSRSSDLLFSHPHSSFDEFPYPPYSELPFSSLKRRRQPGNQWVKWILRAVLASPVIVLVIWNIGVMTFSSKPQIKNANTYGAKMGKAHRNNLRARRSDILQDPMQSAYMQPYMMMPQRGAPMGFPQANVPIAYMAPQGQSAMNSGADVNDGSPTVVTPQYYMSVGGNQLMAVAPPLQQVTPENPMLLQNPLLEQAVQKQAGAKIPVVPTVGGSQNGMVVQPQQVQLEEPQAVVEEPLAVKGSSEVQANPMQMQKRPGIRPHPMPRGQADSKTSVLYYDPKSVTDANGQIHIPSLVYDASGNPIDLSSLQGKQIVMQPPMSAAEPEDVESPLQPPMAQMALSDIKSVPGWGVRTSQDQSIIVGTVAIMALLVGAISARRMRSCAALSSCIENESLLEDDAAYDAACTTTNRPDTSYNTFGGWKGDLEKFDV